jgi:hypothetical protein
LRAQISLAAAGFAKAALVLTGASVTQLAQEKTAEENLAELTAQAETFAQKRLPMLLALMVA